MTWDELRAEAFGEIGLNPTEFYDMEQDDYWLLHKGFFNRRVYESRVIRRAVMILIAPHVEKLPSQYSVMPIPGDDELREMIGLYNDHKSIGVSEAAMKTLREFKEKEKNQKPDSN